MKNKYFQIFEIGTYEPETILDRGTLLKCYWKRLTQSIPRFKNQIWMKNENSTCFPNMGNFGIWAPFRNKIAILYGSSITY